MLLLLLMVLLTALGVGARLHHLEQRKRKYWCLLVPEQFGGYQGEAHPIAWVWFQSDGLPHPGSPKTYLEQFLLQVCSVGCHLDFPTEYLDFLRSHLILKDHLILSNSLSFQSSWLVLILLLRL